MCPWDKNPKVVHGRPLLVQLDENLKDSLLFELCYLGLTFQFPKRCLTSLHYLEHILCKTGLLWPPHGEVDGV